MQRTIKEIDFDGGDDDGESYGDGFQADAAPVPEFEELLNDWAISLKKAEPAKMVAFLEGIAPSLGKKSSGNIHIEVQDWQDMLLGTAAPDLKFIKFLLEAYKHTRSDDMASVAMFKNQALLKSCEAQYGHLPASGLRISHSPKAAKVKYVSYSENASSSEIHPETIPISVPLASKGYIPPSYEQTTDSPFYQQLQALVDKKAEATGEAPEELIKQLAQSLGIHVWALQGFMPLPHDTDTAPLIAKIVDEFFDMRPLTGHTEPDELRRDLHSTADDSQRVALVDAADIFFNAQRTVDICGGQRSGFPMDFGDLLTLLMHQNGFNTNAALATEMKAAGYPITEYSIKDWRRDRWMPRDNALTGLCVVFHLDGAQACELEAAAQLSTAKKKARKAFDTLVASTPASRVTCAKLCDALFSASEIPLQTLSYHLKLYPSGAEAFASGDLVPSPNTVRRIGAFFHLDDEQQQLLETKAGEAMKKIREPKKIKCNQVLGDATLNDSLGDVLNKLFEKDRSSTL